MMDTAYGTLHLLDSSPTVWSFCLLDTSPTRHFAYWTVCLLDSSPTRHFAYYLDSRGVDPLPKPGVFKCVYACQIHKVKNDIIT